MNNVCCAGNSSDITKHTRAEKLFSAFWLLLFLTLPSHFQIKKPCVPYRKTPKNMLYSKIAVTDHLGRFPAFLAHQNFQPPPSPSNTGVMLYQLPASSSLTHVGRVEVGKHEIAFKMADNMEPVLHKEASIMLHYGGGGRAPLLCYVHLWPLVVATADRILHPPTLLLLLQDRTPRLHH